MDGLDDTDFQIEPFVGGPFHAGVDVGELVDQVDQAFGGNERGLGVEGVEQGRWHVAGGGGIDLVDEQVAEVADGIGEQAGQVFAAVGLLVDLFEGGRGVFGEQRAGQFGDGFLGGEPEDVEHIVLGD